MSLFNFLQVVQPLFFFLAEQIDLAGQQGQEEAALRIAYCDVDECCCSPAAVHKLLVTLKAQSFGYLRPTDKDLWHALLHVGGCWYIRTCEWWWQGLGVVNG